MNTWFTSDTHFSHGKIIELCNRPFGSVEEMNNKIIDNFNSMISPDDMLIILGDVCMGPIKESLQLIQEINGHKVLVPGNHDRVWSGYHQKPEKRIEMIKAYEDVGLTIWPESIIRTHSNDNDLSYMLCHFPYEGDSTTDERYKDHRPTRVDDRWLIHGHVHNMWRVNGKQINVGVDVWDFMPVHEEVIEKIIENGGDLVT